MSAPTNATHWNATHWVSGTVSGSLTTDRIRKLLMHKAEIRRLIAPESPATPHSDGDARNEVLRLIQARKREIIERECYSLIEFVEPKHGFDVVGGMDEVKRDPETHMWKPHCRHIITAYPIQFFDRAEIEAVIEEQAA